VILAHADNRLFTVDLDHDFGRCLAKLWDLFDGVEERHYTFDGVEELGLFITSLGPAPDLKALYPSTRIDHRTDTSGYQAPGHIFRSFAFTSPHYLLEHDRLARWSI